MWAGFGVVAKLLDRKTGDQDTHELRARQAFPEVWRLLVQSVEQREGRRHKEGCENSGRHSQNRANSSLHAIEYIAQVVAIAV